MSGGPPPEFFNRFDEAPDPLFYLAARKVTHIDDGAIGAVTALYAELLPDRAVVLDLMSSWRSHLPDGRASRSVGLGMNAEEMAENPQLDSYVVHDVNADPVLPFEDAAFDAVVCCVSVQYMTRPLELFADVARVLRAGGPFVLTMSNRCFPPKAVHGWLTTGDAEHVGIVRRYFELTPGFEGAAAHDRSPGFGDPLFAVFARATGEGR